MIIAANRTEERQGGAAAIPWKETGSIRRLAPHRGPANPLCHLRNLFEQPK